MADDDDDDDYNSNSRKILEAPSSLLDEDSSDSTASSSTTLSSSLSSRIQHPSSPGDEAASQQRLLLLDQIDLCVTCLSQRPPTLPLREELPSLGVELIYRARGAGHAACQRQTRHQAQVLRNYGLPRRDCAACHTFAVSYRSYNHSKNRVVLQHDQQPVEKRLLHVEEEEDDDDDADNEEDDDDDDNSIVSTSSSIEGVNSTTVNREIVLTKWVDAPPRPATPTVVTVPGPAEKLKLLLSLPTQPTTTSLEEEDDDDDDKALDNNNDAPMTDNPREMILHIPSTEMPGALQKEWLQPLATTTTSQPPQWNETTTTMDDTILHPKNRRRRPEPVTTKLVAVWVLLVGAVAALVLLLWTLRVESSELGGCVQLCLW